MPPSGFNQRAVAGALEFVKGCYEDLIAEVKSGKHKDFQSAIKFELSQLEKALRKVHINKEGQLVKRPK